MNSVSIRGKVSRKPYVSAKFAAFSVRPDQPEDSTRAAPTIDVVAFDSGPIDSIASLGEGDAVVIEGHLGSKKATTKDKAAVRVDGRDLWVMQLIADSVHPGEF